MSDDTTRISTLTPLQARAVKLLMDSRPCPFSGSELGFALYPGGHVPRGDTMTATMTPEELTDYRRRHHLSKSALATALDKTPRTVYGYESGQWPIPARVVKRLHEMEKSR